MNMKFRRFISMLLLVCMVVQLVPGVALAEAVDAVRAAVSSSRVRSALEEEFQACAAEAVKAKPLDDGTWQYALVNGGKYAVITGHRDSGESSIAIPRMLGGADVVAIGEDVFQDHDSLMDVTMDGNVYYAADSFLPAGVTVAGYNGTYAESWAEANGKPFRNLSELDFQPGVIDCSGMAPERFTRYNEFRLSMGALEAKRLYEGCIFFLADPNNLYAISYYRAVRITVSGDMAVVECATPDVGDVLRSYHVENQALKPDYSKMELYAPYQGGEVTIFDDDVSAAGFEYDPDEHTMKWEEQFSPQLSYNNFGLSVGYAVEAQISATYYAPLDLEYFDLSMKESFSIGMSYGFEKDFMDDDDDDKDDEDAKKKVDLNKDSSKQDNTSKLQKTLDKITSEVNKKLNESGPEKKDSDHEIELGRIPFFTMFGILNFTFNLSFEAGIEGSLEVTISQSFTQHVKWENGELTASAAKDGDPEIEAVISAELSVGLKLGIGVSIGALEVAEISLTMGVSLGVEYKIPIGILNSEMSYMEQSTAINMADCITIEANFKITLAAEIKAEFTDDIGITVWEGEYEVVDWPLLSAHYHYSRLKLACAGEDSLPIPYYSTFLERFHREDKCPYDNAVDLMVLRDNELTQVGIATLKQTGFVNSPSTLDRPHRIVDRSDGTYIDDWYLSCKKGWDGKYSLSDPVTEWPLRINGSGVLYGEPQPYNTITLVDILGRPMQAFGIIDAVLYVGTRDTVALGRKDGQDFAANAYSGGEEYDNVLPLDANNHIRGWIQVMEGDKDPIDLTKVHWTNKGDTTQVMSFQANGTDQTWMALRDDTLDVNYQIWLDDDIENIYKLTDKFEGNSSIDIPGCWYDAANKQYRSGHYMSIGMPQVTMPGKYSPDKYYIAWSLNDESKALSDYTCKDRYTTSLTFVARIYSKETGKPVGTTPSVLDNPTVKATSTISADYLKYYTNYTDKTVEIYGLKDGYPLSFTIPSTIMVKDIGDNNTEMAFTVTEISSSAFAGKSLDTVLIPDTVVEIGSNAFKGSTVKAVKQISANPDLIVKSSAFRNCANLQTVVLPVIKEIGSDAFRDCTSLTQFSAGQTELISSSAFSGCTNLKQVHITGSKLKTVQGYAFYNCTGLEEVKLDFAPCQNTHNSVYSSWQDPETGLTEKTFEIEATAAGLESSIRSNAFQGCTNLKKVFIDNVEFIQRYAFSTCSNLTYISPIPGLVVIDKHAFYQLPALIYFSAGDKLKAVGNAAFYNCTALEKFSCGAALEAVNYHAFEGCTNLAYFNAGSNIRLLGSEAFSGCANLVSFPECSSLEEIAYGVFKGCNNLQKFVAGPYLRYVGGRAFEKCSSLQYFSAGNSLETICGDAFSGCAELRYFSTGHCLKEIGARAFFDCESIEGFDFGVSPIQTIGHGAFYGCRSLKSIKPLTEIEVLESGVFADCESLKSFKASDRLKSIGASAFSGCTALETVEIGNFVESISSRAFECCTSLKEFDGGYRLKEIESLAFLCCNNLQTFRCGPYLERIGASAFSSCEKLTELPEFPALQTIQQSAFYKCDGMTGFPACPELVTIGKRAFEDCGNLSRFPHCPKLQEIGEYAFVGCNALTAFSAGDAFQYIREGAFFCCSGLLNFSCGEGLEAIASRAFTACFALRDVRLGSKVATIAYDAFGEPGDFEFGKMRSFYTNQYNSLVEQTAAAADRWFYGWGNRKPTLTLQDMDGIVHLRASLEIGTPIVDILAGSLPEGCRGWLIARGDDYESVFIYKDFAQLETWCIIPYMPSCDLTLYCSPTRYAEVEVVAKYDDQVLNTTVYSMICRDTLVNYPPVPSVDGYFFNGWYFDEDMKYQIFIAQQIYASDRGKTTVYVSMLPNNNALTFTDAGDHMVLSGVRITGNSTSVYIPDVHKGKPVTAIAANAFADAASITSVQLPTGLTSFDPASLNALPGLKQLTIADTATRFKTENNLLYSKDGKTLCYVPAGFSAMQLQVKAGVKTIAANAIAAKGLTEITLPDSVTTLGDGAMQACTKLERFTANGLTTVGKDVFSDFASKLKVYGPIMTGALRESLCWNTVSGMTIFKHPYNTYGLAMYVDGKLAAVNGAEAGAPVPISLLCGETVSGTIITNWYKDEALTQEWNSDALMPAQALTLYATAKPMYDSEPVTVNGQAGLRLTHYNGSSTKLTLPDAIGGKPVISIGADLLSGVKQKIASITVGSGVIQILDDPFCLPGMDPIPLLWAPRSTPLSWAADHPEHGNTTARYTLRMQTNGGNSISPIAAVAGTEIRLPAPIKDGCDFSGWFLDEALTQPFQPTTAGGKVYTMPSADTTLYAAWTGQPIPFSYMVFGSQVTVTGMTKAMGTVTVPDTILGLPVTAIASGAFRNHSEITSITLPDSIVSIGSKTFEGCSGLTSFTVGPNVSQIGDAAFLGCEKLAKFVVSADNTTFRVSGSALYTSSPVNLVCYPAGRTTAAVTLLSATKAILPYAFAGSAYMTSVTLPAGLLTMGENAFQGCTALTTVNMSACTKLTEVSREAFSGCSALSDVTLPNSLTTIRVRAFAGCASLKGITIPANVTIMETGIFMPSTFASLTISGYEGSVAQSYAMKYSYPFVSLDSPRSGSCGVNLTWRITDDHVLEITGFGEMYNYPGKAPWQALEQEIQSIRLPEKLTSIGNFAFRGLTQVTAVTIPESVASIGQAAFQDCTGLRKITVPADVDSIGDYVFSGCTGLQDVTFEAMAIPYGAFRNCTGLETIHLGFRVREILSYAFDGCTKLTDVYADQLPSSWQYVFVEESGNDAFRNAQLHLREYRTFRLPAALKEIAEQAFVESAVEKLVVPATVEKIGSQAFSGCWSLEELWFEGSPRELAEDFLYRCRPTIYCHANTTIAAWAEANGFRYIIY